ncbi:hypothetical protein SASPL_106060 [Salvia splendens]|uniref:CCHC-type domain-containing protein n=1 Tax=Salvia splendens TaxID=180675 RepID=A0A8X9ABD0_SALSN|nr:hypothetical protein SASPL_106060 [Salvia splendens]
MQEGMPLQDNLKILNKILLDLRNVDVKVEDEDVALILLVSLPESYENFVESFMTGKETLSLEDVRSVLHIREDRQRTTSSATKIQASGLSATGQKKFGKKKSNSKGFKGGDICRYCKEPGHWKNECPKKKDANGSATMAEADDTNSEDSVALVADEHHTVIGIGSIMIRTHDGVFCTLNDVRHVPHMTNNLISLSTFDSKGLSFKGEGEVMHIMTGSKVVLTALKRGTFSVEKTVGVEDSGSVDKQVELQEDQHTTAETTSSNIHPEARQRSIAIDRARRTSVKPPLKYGFEDMMAYALQEGKSEARKEKSGIWLIE